MAKRPRQGGNEPPADELPPEAMSLSPGALSEPITRFANELMRDGITASVQLPDTEDLTLRLVDRSLLQRFDDARDDVLLHQSLFFAVLGALFGILLGVTQTLGNEGEYIHWSELVAAALLALFSLCCGFLWRRSANRAQRVRARIFKEEESSG